MGHDILRIKVDKFSASSSEFQNCLPLRHLLIKNNVLTCPGAVLNEAYSRNRVTQ